MIKVEDTLFKGRAFVTRDNEGTWLYSEMPVLEENRYMLSKEHRNKNAFVKLTQLDGLALPILLGEPDLTMVRTYKQI